MSTTPPITAWVPKVSAEPSPAEIHRLFTLAFQKLGNHATAFGIQQAKINAIKGGTSTTIVEGGGGGGSIIPPPPATPGGIPVNNQSGQTAYSTASTDDGALIVLSDASAIAISLTSQSPPWSCFITNQSALGAGTATLTPASGTISYAGNPGAASMPLLGGYSTIVAFDGTAWWAFTLPIVPLGFGAVAHEFLTAYNAATGAFTAAQPAFADLSGIATPAQLPAATASAEGIVQLDGDLGGTAVSPQVVGAHLASPLPVAQGGSGTATPSLVAGTGIAVTGSWPNQTVAESSPVLSGTSASLGGSAMTAGQTISANVTITGVTTSMAAVCSPQTYPGASFVWCAYVSAANTVTVTLTAVLAGTPTASAYLCRVIP